MIFTLEHDGMQLEIDSLGCWIKSFTFKGVPILQSTAGNVLDHSAPDASGGFPLLPMANRVSHNSYTLGSKTIQLDKFAPAGEYLHGSGWQSTWQLNHQAQPQAHEQTPQQTMALTLTSDYAHPTNGYDYRAWVTFSLGSILSLNKAQRRVQHEASPRGAQDELLVSLHPILRNLSVQSANLTSSQHFLHIALSVEHLGVVPRLYGLGFHPYFVCEPKQDTLTLNATGYCPEIAHHMSGHITENIPPIWDYRNEKTIAPDFVNHCYVGFSHLTLHRAKLDHLTYQGQISMFSDMPFLMMYHAPESHFLALEPQSHLIDGCNQPGRGGLTLLKQHDVLQHYLCIAF